MEKIKQNISNKLFSFFKGFASVFDIYGQTFKFPDFSGGFARDRQALAGDWKKIGNDLRKAMNSVVYG